MPFTLLPARSPQPNPITELFRDAKTCDREKRKLGRTPYFKPAMVQMRANATDRRMVLTRDISEAGVGLLHLDPLEPQEEITLSVELESRKLVEVAVQIAWCVPCGGGWYISGGEFHDA